MIPSLESAQVQAAVVTVQGGEIQVDGVPFEPHGASGRIKFAELKMLGANTLRNYGEEGDEVMAQAERLDLKVILVF